MKILFDYQIFVDQEYGGISRYFSELLIGFESEGVDADLALLFSNNQHLKELTTQKPFAFFPDKIFSGKGVFLRNVNRLFSILQLRFGKFDVFHPTNYDPYFLKHIGKKPYILTVYDLIQEKFVRQFSNYAGVLENKRKVIESATHIIAISHSTKNDIIEYYGIPEHKITVIHLANSLNKNLPVDTVVVPKKYVLFVGNRDTHKNFIFFINTIAPLLNQEIQLVCAGGGKFSEVENTLFQKLKISSFIQQQSINESKIAFLYQNALCFVFPSLYEGFGLPILEAMGMGCPVLASNSSSLPEVGGDAALYFELDNPESLIENLKQIIVSEDLRKDLQQRGSAREKAFSWQKTVDETLLTYKNILLST